MPERNRGVKEIRIALPPQPKNPSNLAHGLPSQKQALKRVAVPYITNKAQFYHTKCQAYSIRKDKGCVQIITENVREKF